MFYIYFPYAAVLGGLILFECYTKHLPRWWAAMVFCAPVTAPYFIYKIRKQSGMMLILIFIATFSAACFAEWFIYVRYVEKNRYAHLSPIERHIVTLSREVMDSTIQLDNALVKLETLSKVEARIKQIKKTIDFIKELRILMIKNQSAIQQLVKFTRDNETMFRGKKFEWIYQIQRYYDNRNVVQHYESLQKYLVEFESLLEYTYVNFYAIRDHKIDKHLKNYDEYYIRYRSAVDSHNRFNVRRIEFQNNYLKKFPKIKEYLPGERQTETFKLWL